MCGINGILTFEKKIDIEIIKLMNEVISYRGPDEEGYYFDDNISLGHRRLSIIDLYSGSQPIFNEDKNIVIIFNGEIYNFIELRKELENAGHSFSTKTDTEVIVHLYEEYGVDCLNKLDGMFAFALWDKKKKQLFLAVDRLGKKPLVYYWDGKVLIFSSEIKGILASGLVRKEIDFNALNLYFTFGYIPAPYTIYKGIKKLLPAHYLLIQKDKFYLHRYWSPLQNCYKNEYGNLSFNEAKEYLIFLLENAVKKRLISDVPLGAFLSGGIDSSIIVSIMARILNNPVKTFSIGYKNNNFFDETSYAKEVAKVNLTEHHEIKISHSDVLEVIPKVLNSLDEPFADYSLIPTYIVSQQTRKYVKVALSGDGGDELFAGYDKYLGEVYSQIYLMIPSMIRKLFFEFFIKSLPVYRQNNFADFVRKLRKFIDSIDKSQSRCHFNLMNISPFSKNFLNLECEDDELSLNLIENLFHEFYSNSSKPDKINAMLYTDISFELPYNMLFKVDRASMWNSLEVRSPFLDYRLVEFVMKLPGSFKMRRMKRKYILHKAFDQVLPVMIRKRPKMGFELPLSEWLKREIKGVFLDVVGVEERGENDLINKELVLDIFKAHCQNKWDYTKLLWAIFVFQWWRKKWMH